MLEFISANFASIIIGIIIAVLISLVVFKMVRDKKKGRSSCGCCSDCPSCGACHRNK